MKRISFPLTSLRSRPAIVVGLMLVPLVTLGIGAIYSHRTATNALTRTTIEITKEIEPVCSLQLAIEKAAMPPHDYMITENVEERAAFARLGRQTDSAFKAVLRSPLNRRERHLTRSAFREWQIIKRRSLAILAIPRPRNDAGAAETIKRLDAQIERAVFSLDLVQEEAHREIIERLALVDRLERQAFSIVILIFAISVVTTASIGTMLARSVIRPLQILTDGAARLAAGDLRYRAPKLNIDELDQFGRTFNIMADRLTAYLEDLKAGEARFHAIVDTAVSAIITFDKAGKIQFVNKAIERMLGYAPDELIGQNIAILMPERFEDLNLFGINRSSKTGEKHALGKATELAAVKKDGSECPIELSVADWKAEGRQFFTGMIQDITARKATEQLLRQMSITDSLTGLYNHAEFYRRLTEELGRSRRYGSPVSLLMLDIDYFKEVNDEYGHQAGDNVLLIVTDIIVKTVRPIDIITRYGGEEFAIILPETDSAGAMATAERLRRRVEERIMRVNKRRTAKITVSIGVAECPLDATSVDALVGRADEAMYAAKAAGRNLVRTSKKAA